jgi:hypothetical protein
LLFIFCKSGQTEKNLTIAGQQKIKIYYAWRNWFFCFDLNFGCKDVSSRTSVSWMRPQPPPNSRNRSLQINRTHFARSELKAARAFPVQIRAISTGTLFVLTTFVLTIFVLHNDCCSNDLWSYVLFIKFWSYDFRSNGFVLTVLF